MLSSDSAVVRTWAGGENAYHRRVKAESLGPQLGEAGASQQVFDFASGVAVGAAWHRAWQDGGAQALRSKGPVSRERLSPQQWARLEAKLTKGLLARVRRRPAVEAGPDQTLIGKLFHVGSPPPAAALASRSAPSALSIPGGLAGPDESTAGAD